MWDEGRHFSDGAMIARSVRELARQAHLALADPADEDEARLVFAAIDRLEQQIESCQSEHLERWLTNLRRRVEGRIPATV